MRLFKKDQILTIPNFLSLLRLVMIPWIVALYREGNYYGATGVIVLSGLTDVADGFIARKFDMVSDFGKILDPIADKLTQAVLIGCLITRYSRMLPLLILFAVKEVIMGITGILVIKKKDVVNSAQWFGKLATAVLYAVLILLFLFPGISEAAADIMILCCAGVILLALVKYQFFYIKLVLRREE